jgi:hypothetical protein
MPSKILIPLWCLGVILVWSVEYGKAQGESQSEYPGITSIAPESVSPEISKSCADFIQGFYNWYYDNALKQKQLPAWYYALKHKPQVFSHVLLKALKEDSDARSEGEDIVLNFDPFLSTVGHVGQFELGEIRKQGSAYFAEISVINSIGKKVPTIWPELKRTNGHWVFVNFHYPYANTDLLIGLKIYRGNRQRHK